MEEMMEKIDLLRQILRKERERKRLSQAKVAERMGISPSHLSGLENGKQGINLELLLKWCVNGLRLSPDRILEKWKPSFLFNGRKKRKRKKPKPEERCIECKTTEMKLFAKILCVGCYNKYVGTRHREDTKVPGIGGWLIPKATYVPRIRTSQILTKEYLLEEYVSKNKSVKEIAVESRCSPLTIYKMLKSYNIPLRDRASERRLKCNEEFFTSWSPKMAYVLGVIFTDGCLYPGRSKDPPGKAAVSYCRISQRDPEFLTKVLALMDSKARIYFAKQKRKGEIVGGIYSIIIYSEKIYDDLIGLGLTPHKSQTMKFPYVPPECMRHFIRGCWDGDGSVHISKDRSRTLAASYVSGSPDFIEGVVEELYRVGVYRLSEREKNGKSRLTIHERGKSYQIKVSAKESLENLFHYLYDGVDESLYLERKYENFLEGLTAPSEKISSKRTRLSLKPLCQLMKRERMRRGLSQRKVTETMGISYSYLSELEQGKYGLRLDLWIPWCSALGISPSYVIARWQDMGGFAIESHQGHGE